MQHGSILEQKYKHNCDQENSGQLKFCSNFTSLKSEFDFLKSLALSHEFFVTELMTFFDISLFFVQYFSYC